MPELRELMITYFQTLLKFTRGNLIHILECIDHRVTLEDNIALIRKVNNEEVRKVVFIMKPNKFPRFEGINPRFYQFFWDIMGNEVVKFCDQFLITSCFPKNISRTQIVLIPKKKS